MDDIDFSESPIRRLEKRLENIESNGFTFDIKKFVEDNTKIMKENQSMVSDVMRSNNDLRSDIEAISNKMDTFLSSMNEFLSLLKIASQETAEPSDNLTKKVSELTGYNRDMLQINQSILTTLELIDKRLKRLYSENTKEGETEQTASYGIENSVE